MTSINFNVLFKQTCYQVTHTCNDDKCILRIEVGQELFGMATIDHVEKSIDLVTAVKVNDFIETTEHYDLYRGPGQFASLFITELSPRNQVYQ